MPAITDPLTLALSPGGEGTIAGLTLLARRERGETPNPCPVADGSRWRRTQQCQPLRTPSRPSPPSP